MQESSRVNNYVKLDDFSWRYQYYAYIDVKSYLMDKLIVERKIKVKIKSEYENKQNDYMLIIAKVPKKQVDLFLEACNELYGRMKEEGYEDYEDMCKHIQESLNVDLLS